MGNSSQIVHVFTPIKQEEKRMERESTILVDYDNPGALNVAEQLLKICNKPQKVLESIVSECELHAEKGSINCNYTVDNLTEEGRAYIENALKAMGFTVRSAADTNLEGRHYGFADTTFYISWYKEQ